MMPTVADSIAAGCHHPPSQRYPLPWIFTRGLDLPIIGESANRSTNLLSISINRSIERSTDHLLVYQVD